jgi:hypothetical protein
MAPINSQQTAVHRKIEFTGEATSEVKNGPISSERFQANIGTDRCYWRGQQILFDDKKHASPRVASFAKLSRCNPSYKGKGKVFTVRMYTQACFTDPCGLQETNVSAVGSICSRTPAIVQPHKEWSWPDTAIKLDLIVHS